MFFFLFVFICGIYSYYEYLKMFLEEFLIHFRAVFHRNLQKLENDRSLCKATVEKSIQMTDPNKKAY